MPFFVANAKLFYQPTNIPEVAAEDPITGQPIFSASDPVVLPEESIEVSIEEDDDQSRIHSLPGKDVKNHFVTGRLVTPSTFPSWYKVGAILKIVWDNGKEGKFYVLDTVSSRFSLESVFGQPVAGRLIP